MDVTNRTSFVFSFHRKSILSGEDEESLPTLPTFSSEVRTCNKWLSKYYMSSRRQLNREGILFILYRSLVCQEHHYGSGLVLMESLEADRNRRLVMVRYTFGNGAVLYHLTNTYAIHLMDWEKQLSIQMGGIALDAFDHVILGTINSCLPPVRTNFAEGMKELLYSRFGVTCERANGPSLTEFSNVFKQPLLYVSMFATYARKDVQRDKAEFKALKNHTGPLRWRDARTYVKEMGVDEWECGSTSTKTILDCVNNSTARQRLHRCTGPHGGHTDIVAWDVVEFLNSNYAGFDYSNHPYR